MPFTCRIDRESRTIVLTFTGAVTSDDLIAAQRTLLDSPDFHPTYDRLIDLSSIESVDVTADSVRFVAGQARLEPPAKCAIVAERQVAFGLARLYGLSCCGAMSERTEVFRGSVEAKMWLAGCAQTVPSGRS